MSTLQKIQRGLVFVVFIGVLVISTEYAGFSIGGRAAAKTQLIKDAGLMWLLTICFGAVGGLILNPKKFMATVPSGIISACGIAGAVLLYLSFRESIYQVELVIPLFIGLIPGLLVYPLLHKLIYRTDHDLNSSEKSNVAEKAE